MVSKQSARCQGHGWVILEPRAPAGPACCPRPAVPAPSPRGACSLPGAGGLWVLLVEFHGSALARSGSAAGRRCLGEARKPLCLRWRGCGSRQPAVAAGVGGEELLGERAQHRRRSLARSGGVRRMNGVQPESALAAPSWFCTSCREVEGGRKASACQSPGALAPTSDSLNR